MEDAEPSKFLRRVRELFGYGHGWTFRAALWEWSYPKLVVLAIILMWAWKFEMFP